jgi:hypothetical protein
VVAVTPEQQRWLDAEVRPVVERAAAEIAGSGAGGRRARRHQRQAWGIVLGLVVLVGLVELGFLVGVVLAHSVQLVP